MAETMTKAQKAAAVDLAWATYRAESQAIPRNLPFSAYRRDGRWEPGFLERDEALFKRYLAAERSVEAVPEPKPKAA